MLYRRKDEYEKKRNHKKAPVILDVIGNLSGWTKEVLLSVSADDKESGLALDGYSFDGGETWQKENKKTFTENGKVEILVKDKAGNLSLLKTVDIKNMDHKAPVVSEIKKTPDTWTKEQVVVEVTAEDKESGLAVDAYSFDGGKTFQKENSKVFSKNAAVEIVVKDVVGNLSEVKVEEITKIDQVKPVVVGALLKPETWTNGSVTIEVTGNDTGSGLALDAYSFDGGETW